jgi:hypothetical protein
MSFGRDRNYLMVDVVRPQAFDEFDCLLEGYNAVVVRLHKQHG